MTTRKTMLCRCEDLTVGECRDAIQDGYACFEDLKRFLGVGTGPCQGKSCVQAAMHLVASERGIPVSAVDVMTFRPPVRPISFATLAAADAPVEDSQSARKPDAPSRALATPSGPPNPANARTPSGASVTPTGPPKTPNSPKPSNASVGSVNSVDRPASVSAPKPLNASVGSVDSVDWSAVAKPSPEGPRRKP